MVLEDTYIVRTTRMIRLALIILVTITTGIVVAIAWHLITGICDGYGLLCG